jgi:hypothetical protein
MYAYPGTRVPELKWALRGPPGYPGTGGGGSASPEPSEATEGSCGAGGTHEKASFG